MKTVLVTGGNRGIGYEICRQLDELGHTVILGSRDVQKGKEAVRNFSKNVIVHPLDVTADESVRALFEFTKKRFGKLDVLINNAGIGSRHEAHENTLVAGAKKFLKNNFRGAWKTVKPIVPFLKKAGLDLRKNGVSHVSTEDVKHVMETNFYGPLRMISIFLPLLEKSADGRIINMSSGTGQLKNLTGEYPAYSLSKNALNALTIMFSNELSAKNITVNAMCPGWVRTDMGGPDAPRPVSKGAETAVWLTIEEKIPSGKFFRDKTEIPW